MPIARGQDWGEPGALFEGAAVVRTDADAMSAVRDDVAAARVAEVGVLGGDLHRSLGSPRHDADDLREGRGTRFEIDVAEVDLTRPDGTVERHWFCAHLMATERDRKLFSAPSVVVMNAAFHGADNLGPRAHPNDGLLDVTEGRLSRRDRLRAEKRMATGTHVPHPELSTSRVRSFEIEFAEPASVRLDDSDLGRVRSMVVRCLPDALVVVV